MYCFRCGKKLPEGARFCPECGVRLPELSAGASTAGTPSGTHELKTGRARPQKRKKWVVAVLLSWFLGQFGADRFYLGYTLSGILKMLTFGGFYIWAFVDFIRIAFNRLPAKDGALPEGREGNEWIAYLLLDLTLLILITTTVVWIKSIGSSGQEYGLFYY